MRVSAYILWSLLLIPLAANALDRCNQYAQPVRKAHAFYFGLDYPSQYGVGQLEAESACRHVVSADGFGSSTPAQITYSMWNKQFAKAGLASAHWTTQQAYIMKEAHDKNQYQKLWVTYQVYNGGVWVKKEIAAAGVVDWSKARDQCTRGYTTYKSGQKVSNCDVNYEYSQEIFLLGRKYESSHSKKYEFW